jgi:hypothetical protein
MPDDRKYNQLTPSTRQAAKALTSEHVTFVVMPDAAEGVNQHLRFGGMSEIMMWNRQDNDATLPDLSPQGIATSAFQLARGNASSTTSALTAPSRHGLTAPPSLV